MAARYTPRDGQFKAEPVLGCLERADGTKVSVLLHFSYGKDAAGDIDIDRDLVTDAQGVEIVLAADDVVTPGVCRVSSPECVESQEWTYGIDNTGTNYAEDNTIEFTLSDGSTFTFNQPPATSWTPQMQVWGDEIQAAADAAGLAWFVETRFRDPTNPSNLAGGGGFSGPPSVAVSNALVNMAWRYVNIQICPGQAVPVGAKIIDSSNPARIGYDLTADGAVLGPIQKFVICRDCGEAPLWYLEDGVTEAEAGQIPNCYEPCGTLALVSAPPDRDCVFQTELACDDNNSNLTADYIPDITRRATICNGEQIAVDYFQADPADPTALIDYTLLGRFVDCATGEEIELPDPPCSDFDVEKVFRLSGDGFNGLLTNREWQGTQPVGALINDIETATPAGRAIRDAHDFSLPTSNAGTQASLVLNDQDNTGAELSIQVLDGYIYEKTGGWYQYASTSEGYWAVELGKCCGPLEDLVEQGGFFPTRSMQFYIPAGTHQIRIWNVDTGGSNSSATLGYSVDGGVTYINDNTPPTLLFGNEKVQEECLLAKICKDTDDIFDLLTGDLLDAADLYTCSIMCAACCGGDSSDNLLSLITETVTECISEGDEVIEKTESYSWDNVVDGSIGDVNGDGDSGDTKWSFNSDAQNAPDAVTFTDECITNGDTVTWEWLSGGGGSQTFDASSYTSSFDATGQATVEIIGGLASGSIISGFVNSLTVTCVSQSSTVEKVIGSKGCNDDRRDDLLEEIANKNCLVTDVTPNPDQTHVVVSGTGNVPAGLKTVTINNISGTTTIDGGFELGTGRRVDTISFDATEVDRARALLPAMTLAGGTWQWVGLQPIAEV